jgi:hypothetical protein
VPQAVGVDAVVDASLALCGRNRAEALVPVCPLPLRKPKVDQNASSMLWVVEEVCGLYVAMEDAVSMYGDKGSKETSEVQPDVAELHVSEVFAKVHVLKEGENSDDLVLVSKGRDERANGVAIFEVVQQLKLIEDSLRAAGNVYLLDCY